MFTSDVFCNWMDGRQRPMKLCYTLRTEHDPSHRFLCNYQPPLLRGGGQQKKDSEFPDTSAEKSQRLHRRYAMCQSLTLINSHLVLQDMLLKHNVADQTQGHVNVWQSMADSIYVTS